MFITTKIIKSKMDKALIKNTGESLDIKAAYIYADQL